MKTPAPTPLLSLHQLSLYNTGRMSAEHVIAAFAARRQQFERIIADLAAEQAQSRAQHHLIVGQRGMGKTMLLARVAAEFRTQDKLAARFIPLVFAEEQYAVDRLSKFWLNCLDSLADARELAKGTKAVDEIDATVARLMATGTRAAKDDQPFANEVYEAFIRAAQATGQRPILLVDNLQLVFERLENGQQHSLRELLMRPGGPILVGASPSPPPQTQDYGAAFYDHFKVHYLRPLDVEEMRALLVHLAVAAQRDDVRQKVLQHPARLAVLRQLTGGNPRTVVTLFFLYAEDFAPSVFGDLEGLLDRVTPLYKARFEELTTQQQVVTSAIADHWDPVTAAKLATITSLPATTISAQLDRLEKIGAIERTELFGETRTGYQLAERFFNIWFLMRSASRRQRREVEFLTRFLENFYEPTDRSRLASHMQSERDFSADRQVWAHALACTLDPTEAHDLKRHAELDALRQKEATARKQLEEVIDFSALPPSVLAFAELREKLTALVPPEAGVRPEEFANEVLGDRQIFLSGDREKLASRAPLSAEEVQKVLDSIGASRATDAAQYGTEAVEWLSRRLAKGQLAAANDIEDWDTAFRQAPQTGTTRLLLRTIADRIGAKLAPDVVSSICQKLQPAADATGEQLNGWALDLHFKLQNSERAELVLRQATARDDATDDWWFGLGCCLASLSRYDESIAAYQKAIALNENSYVAWAELGYVLGRVGQNDEAEAAYRKAIAINGNSTYAWCGLGDFLRGQVKRFEETEAAYRKAILISDEHASAWSGLGLLLRDNLSRFDEAEAALKHAISVTIDKTWGWIELGYLYFDFLNRLPDAIDAFEKAARISPDNQYSAHPLLFLHRDFLGEGLEAEPRHQQFIAHSGAEWHVARELHAALSAAYAQNWGLASESLGRALAESIPAPDSRGWLRDSAVLLHLNYGAELLAFLDGRGETARLRPWVEALRAHQLGDRRALLNIAPEVRTAAESFYDGIARYLAMLPEKTRRRPLPLPRRTRARRQRASVSRKP